ncbi:hypothetical protein P7C70_g5022, partial [Phenoliferia sp. Uapishka_3]
MGMIVKCAAVCHEKADLIKKREAAAESAEVLANWLGTGGGASAAGSGKGASPKKKRSQKKKEGLEIPPQLEFQLTSSDFWAPLSYWEVPVGLPYFRERSAITWELYNLLLELRPRSLTKRLEESFRQIQLQFYWSERVAYFAECKRRHALFNARQLARSEARDLAIEKNSEHIANGFPLLPANNPALYPRLPSPSVPDSPPSFDEIFSPISGPIMDASYLHFSKSRKEEGSRAMRAIPAQAISADAVVKFRKKMTTTDSVGTRSTPFTGGIDDIVNENQLCVGWYICWDMTSKMLSKMIAGLMRRMELLGTPKIALLAIDTCCQSGPTILAGLPYILAILLDFWHFLQRYLTTIYLKKKNAHYSEVSADIVMAIMVSTASNGRPAQYRPKLEQEAALIALYTKWERVGGVWSALSPAAHTAQLKHVRNGCLDRPAGLENLRAETGANEVLHSYLNDIQRAAAGGIVMTEAQVTDALHRRNTRIAFDKKLDPFVTATQGSHHYCLVESAFKLEDQLSGTTSAKFLDIQSGETFGLVKQSHEFFKEEEVDMVMVEEEMPGWVAHLHGPDLKIDGAKVAELSSIPLPTPSSHERPEKDSSASKRSRLEPLPSTSSLHRPQSPLPRPSPTPARPKTPPPTTIPRPIPISPSVALVAKYSANPATFVQSTSSNMCWPEWETFTTILLEKKVNDVFTHMWGDIAKLYNERLIVMCPSRRYHDKKNQHNLPSAAPRANRNKSSRRPLPYFATLDAEETE